MSHEAAPLKLYHASPNIEGDYILPRPTTFTGSDAYEYAPFVFAAPASENTIGDLRELYAIKVSDAQMPTKNKQGDSIAFDYSVGVGSYPIGQHHVAIGIYSQRESYLKQLEKLHPTIYEVPPHYFESVVGSDGQTREYVARQPIPLTECQIAKTYYGLNEILAHGNQIFFVAPGQEEVFCHAQKMAAGADPLAFFRDCLASGLLTHENARRGICPMDMQTGQVPDKVKTVSFVESVRSIHAKQTMLPMQRPTPRENFAEQSRRSASGIQIG